MVQKTSLLKKTIVEMGEIKMKENKPKKLKTDRGVSNLKNCEGTKKIKVPTTCRNKEA